MPAADPLFEHAPYRLSGTVVAALLNHRQDWALLGEAACAAPYKAPAQRPVLGVRPPNTWARDGDALRLPAGQDAWQVGATLGIVIGRPACRVPVGQALQQVAGYLLVHDGSLPVQSHYRPALRQRARDGCCVIGPRLVPADAIPDPDALAVEVWIDGRCVQRTDTGSRVRPVAALLSEVSAFMTLSPGDLLLLGAAPPAPLAEVGSQVCIRIAGLGELNNRVCAEEAA
ncbi:MAG: fumarylacetoacetate hydrolase family protein [Rubrivivax sp.]|nr:fumarylacetoacetate hydrolase family protein [Rubrivivax sp.]